MNRAIIYTRVSTDEQADKGYSLQFQKLALEKYCEIKGLKIVRHFQEDYSAKNFDRPEWKKLEEFVAINKKVIDHIHFTRWDRFSRNETDAKIVLKRFQKMGININSIDQPIDLNVPDYKLMLSFYLTLPEIENDKNSIRTTEGSRQARLQGCWTGTPPRGYNCFRNESGKSTLLPNDEAAIVVEIFKEVQKGTQSIDSIRKQFNRRGFKMSKQGVHNMLRNVCYIGKVFVKEWKKEPFQIVEGLHEGIVDKEVFSDVQLVLTGKKKINKPHKKTDSIFPLRGYLNCPGCGRVLTGGFSTGRSKRKYPYYKCQNNCPGVSFGAINANESFENYLNSIGFSSEAKDLFELIIKDIVREKEGDRLKETLELKSQIENIESLLKNAEDEFFARRINQELFNSVTTRYTIKISELKVGLNDVSMRNKEMGRSLRFSLGILANLSTYYTKASIEAKQAIIGSIFPENLVFWQNNYRTTRINAVLELITMIDKDLKSGEMKMPGKNAGQSIMAPAAGLEPATL